MPDMVCSPKNALWEHGSMSAWKRSSTAPLSGTINYADIVSCIAQQLDTPSQLLEHLVYRSGQSLMDTFPQINHLTLSIFKENPPMKAQCDEIGIKMDFARQ